MQNVGDIEAKLTFVNTMRQRMSVAVIFALQGFAALVAGEGLIGGVVVGGAGGGGGGGMGAGSCYG